MTAKYLDPGAQCEEVPSHEEFRCAGRELPAGKQGVEHAPEELRAWNEELLRANAELRDKVARLEAALRASEPEGRLKLASVLSPEGDLGELELGDIIDAGSIQALVDDFYLLTGLPMGLGDLSGKVLVGAGWQEACTRFHRCHPDSLRNCQESDLQLSRGIPAGEYKIYRCKNNMWDVATPVMVGDRQFGNLFLGQFFFEEETLDYGLFRAQAKEFGFDEQQYLRALEAAPRMNRETLDLAMSFFMKLADLLSQLSYSNLKLARSLAERDALMASLAESEERLRFFIEYAPASLAMFDNDMRYLSASRHWSRDYGLGERDLTGVSHYDIFPEIPTEWREAHRRGLAGEVLRAEADRFERADGSVQWTRWEIRPWYDGAGNIGGIVIFSDDVSELKKAEGIRRRYELLAGFSRDIILFVSPDDGRILEANAAALKSYGYDYRELLELSAADLRATDSREPTAAQLVEAASRGILFETVHRRKDGSRFPVEVSSQGATIGGTRMLISVIRDSTERKRTELEREASVEFLRLANESRGTGDLVRMAVTFFRELSGCQAVGIRLREGEDFPYYESAGFPQEFVRGENSLCSRDGAGEIRRAASGNPLLDCMCGNVIRGRFDPAQPFFSAEGSFWTNSTTQLLVSSSEADRQARTRNRCHGEGYESVALIPLRLGEERLGLLQLNDRRPGRFTPEAIALWERLADYLAVALAKYRAEEALRESERRYSALFANKINGMAHCRIITDAKGRPVDYRILQINEAYERIIGIRREAVEGRRVKEVFPEIGDYAFDYIGIYGKIALEGGEIKFEEFFEATGQYLSVYAYSPLPGEFAAIFSDVTERKLAEEELHRAHDELELRVRERTEELALTVSSLREEITEREQAEKSLHEETLARLDAVEDLRAKERMLLQQSRLAAMGEMLNNIAHQWRQPLNVLGLVLQQMQLIHQMGSFSGEYLDSSVDKSMGLINHMSQTIDDFRDFFKPDKEKVEFAVHEVVSRTVTLVADGFKYQQIGIALHAGANPTILGFPNEYCQVLLNILMNARDVLLERCTEDARVTVSIGQEGARGVVVIADNAGGIPEEILDRVFEPYFSTKGPDKGTGVGLFMSKLIIENNMGGRLTVRNGAQGAEFRVEV